MVACGTVPILLTSGVTWTSPGPIFDNLLGPRLHEAVAFYDIEGLATFVAVPRGPSARGEVHCADAELRAIGAAQQGGQSKTSSANESAGPLLVGFFGWSPNSSPSVQARPAIPSAVPLVLSPNS